jgi:hypothetical protein
MKVDDYCQLKCDVERMLRSNIRKSLLDFGNMCSGKCASTINTMVAPVSNNKYRLLPLLDASEKVKQSSGTILAMVELGTGRGSLGNIFSENIQRLSLSLLLFVLSRLERMRRSN